MIGALYDVNSADPMEIIESCKAECEKAEENLKNNLFNVHDEIKNLEVTYRALDSFFANAGQGKIDCITLMNVNKEELGDNDSEGASSLKTAMRLAWPEPTAKRRFRQ